MKQLILTLAVTTLCLPAFGQAVFSEANRQNVINAANNAPSFVSTLENVINECMATEKDAQAILDAIEAEVAPPVTTNRERLKIEQKIIEQAAKAYGKDDEKVQAAIDARNVTLAAIVMEEIAEAATTAAAIAEDVYDNTPLPIDKPVDDDVVLPLLTP